MGTEISLDIGGYGIAWSKNSLGIHHGSLFQEDDRKIIPNEYRDGYPDYVSNSEPSMGDWGFIRPLKNVVPRLEMLGFTLDRAKQDYELACQEARENYTVDSIYDSHLSPQDTLLTFDEFIAFIQTHPLSRFNREAQIGQIEPDAHKSKALTDDNRSLLIPGSMLTGRNVYSELTYFGDLIDILHPYSTLRVLASAPENGEEDLVWHYGPLCDSGWEEPEIFTSGARRDERFLIATEGTSDTAILKHAIKILEPDILDFFHFIDSEESHPFTGAGNLKRLAEGLAKIDVQNKTVIVFDNDTAGVDACYDVENFKLPLNMSTFILPDLPEFKALSIRGPDGLKTSDLNGRAIAIECYLDLRIGPEPIFNWTDRKKASGNFQGSLQAKEKYVKPFLKLNREDVESGQYDLKKICILLQGLINQCIEISERCN